MRVLENLHGEFKQDFLKMNLRSLLFVVLKMIPKLSRRDFLKIQVLMIWQFNSSDKTSINKIN